MFNPETSVYSFPYFSIVTFYAFLEDFCMLVKLLHSFICFFLKTDRSIELSKMHLCECIRQDFLSVIDVQLSIRLSTTAWEICVLLATTRNMKNCWVQYNCFAPESVVDLKNGCVWITNCASALQILEVKVADIPDVNLTRLGVTKYGNFTVEVVDPVADYLELMEVRNWSFASFLTRYGMK